MKMMKKILLLIIIVVAFAGCTTDYQAETSGWHDVNAYEARSVSGRGDPATAQAQEGNEERPNTFTF